MGNIGNKIKLNYWGFIAFLPGLLQFIFDPIHHAFTRSTTSQPAFGSRPPNRPNISQAPSYLGVLYRGQNRAQKVGVLQYLPGSFVACFGSIHHAITHPNITNQPSVPDPRIDPIQLRLQCKQASAWVPVYDRSLPPVMLRLQAQTSIKLNNI